jgi:hypothetical protein
LDLAMLACVSFAIFRVGWAISERNRFSKFNGFGCIDDVILKRADAPMAYRVLMPLLVAKIPKNLQLIAYALFQIVGIFLLLLTCKVLVSLQFALLLGVLVTVTMRFDYWDWIPEMGAFVSCVAGDPVLALSWSAAAALSRETSVILPLVWIASGHDLRNALFILADVALLMFLVRIWQGKKKMYCDRIMISKNGEEVHRWMLSSLHPKPNGDMWSPATIAEHKLGAVFLSDMTVTIMLTVGAILSAAHFGIPHGLAPAVLAAAGWTFAIARENRVMGPTLIWIALWFCDFKF